MNKTPYYAVIFSSKTSGKDTANYAKMADRMVELASQQKGYLEHESYSNESDGKITVSYWETLEDIKAWRHNMEHQEAQRQGKEKWYATYRLRIAKVERDYSFKGID